MTTKRRILIADDDRRIREALTLRLEMLGFEVLTTADGYQAVAQARRLRPDVVVLDVGMPAGDGFTVHERLRKIDELTDVPVVYLTGRTSDDIEDTAMRLGAYAVLHKPFDASELLETILGAIEESEERAEAAVGHGPDR